MTEDDDPFLLPVDLIPAGTSYQWVAKRSECDPYERQYTQMRDAGWTHVPAHRHAGLFPIAESYGSIIEVRGQYLMERPTEDCDKATQRNVRQAREQVDYCLKQFAEDGLFGGVRSWTGGEAGEETPPAYRLVGDPVVAQKIIDGAPQDGEATPQPPAHAEQ